jgi:hypothetical protein
VDQARDLNQGAGRIVVTPKLGSDLVNGLKVFHVHQEDVDAGNVLQGAAHGLQGGLYIVEHLAGLQPDVSSANQVSLGIDGYLAGNKVVTARVRQRGVGKDAEGATKRPGIVNGFTHACFLL